MKWIAKLKWWHTHRWSQWSEPIEGKLKYTVSHGDGPYFPRTVPIYAQKKVCLECGKIETRVQDCLGNRIANAQDYVMGKE